MRRRGAQLLPLAQSLLPPGVEIDARTPGDKNAGRGSSFAVVEAAGNDVPALRLSMRINQATNERAIERCDYFGRADEIGRAIQNRGLDRLDRRNEQLREQRGRESETRAEAAITTAGVDRCSRRPDHLMRVGVINLAEPSRTSMHAVRNLG